MQNVVYYKDRSESSYCISNNPKTAVAQLYQSVLCDTVSKAFLNPFMSTAPYYGIIVKLYYLMI